MKIEKLNSDSIQEVAKVLAKGALMGARGNSGVILSQILRMISVQQEIKFLYLKSRTYLLVFSYWQNDK